MKICSKCNVEKELDQFDKYFHSTQQKERIRGYCKSCFRLQKKQYKESIRKEKIIQPVEDIKEPEVLEHQYDTNIFKFCPDCKEWKLIEQDFYRHSKRFPNARCKECERQKDKDEYWEKMEAKGGHDMCPVKPGVYADKWQQEQTETFLTVLGWKKTDEGVWWKEGFKTPDGVWTKDNGRRPLRVYKKERNDKGLVRGLRVPGEIQYGIIDMYEKKHKQIEIIKKYSVCKQTIRKVIANHLNRSQSEK